MGIVVPPVDEGPRLSRVQRPERSGGVMDRADVVIIGGGVTGLSSAYWLTKAGLDVVVVEKGIVGWEASGRNGGISSRRGEELPVVPLAREA